MDQALLSCSVDYHFHRLLIIFSILIPGLGAIGSLVGRQKSLSFFLPPVVFIISLSSLR